MKIKVITLCAGRRGLALVLALVTRETVRRQFLDLWGVEMHADSRREAFTPDRIRLLSAAFRNHMHWSELIGGDVVISPPCKWQVLFNASDLRVMPRANRLACRLA